MGILIKLFLSFFKIGAFSFGGGYAMLPLIKKEIIEIHSWLTVEEFIDILAVSEMTPGPVAINSATFLGYKVYGVIGSIVATFAVVLPSFIVMSIIVHFLKKFKNSKSMSLFFEGIRPVVFGLILSAAFTVGKDAFIDIKSVLLSITIFYLVIKKELNPILAIIMSGIIGIILY